jgi:hypothetical protein
MKKTLNKIYDLPLYATTTALAAMTTTANAQSDIGDVAEKLTGQLSSLGTLVGGGAFLGGIFFIATGLFKLKQAADTQGQQVKYGDGVWRLALGSALVALPAVMGVGVGTFFGDNADTTINFRETFESSAGGA